MKLLRTIQLDPSDTFVFEKAAEPGEWAVSGTFAFWASNPAPLEDTARSAFHNGFLDVSSFGWSTPVQIVEAGQADHARLIETLVQRLAAHFGVTNIEAARTAAEDEVAFDESVCNHPQGTLVSVQRIY
jgi:hypothetical protein